MQQKLSVFSVLLLLLMAGISTVMVAAHAISQASPNSSQIPILQNPTPSNATSVAITVTVTTTTTTASTTTTTDSTNSTSTMDQNSGSLLLTTPPQSGQNYTGDDDGYSGGNWSSDD